MDIEEVKDAVNQKYRNVIGENVKDIFAKSEEEANQNEGSGPKSQYIWKPLKYGIKDVYDKKDEVINDLVDEIYFSTHRMQPKPITIPKVEFLDMKLRDQGISIVPNQEPEENQTTIPDKIESLLSIFPMKITVKLSQALVRLVLPSKDPNKIRQRY